MLIILVFILRDFRSITVCRKVHHWNSVQVNSV